MRKLTAALALSTLAFAATPTAQAQSAGKARSDQKATASPPSNDASALANGLLAVLEFRSKLQGKEHGDIDVGYLAQEVRFMAREALPSLKIITKENILEIIGGKSLADCESECEVETGRKIGADLVVTGEFSRFGNEYKLALTLYETRGQSVIKGVFVSGKSLSELDQELQKRVAELLEPLKPKGRTLAPLGAVEAAAQSLPEVPTLAGQLQAGAVVPNDVNPDLLVARERAIDADAKGKDAPETAATAWQALADVAGENPYRDDAAARAKEWRAFTAKKRAFEKQLADDTERLKKILPLRSVAEPIKLEMLVRYARLYGAAAAEPLRPLLPSEDARAAASAALGCEAKDRAACLSLAQKALAANDAPRALVLFEQACEAGAPEGCEHAGAMYLDAEGAARDVARGLSFLDRACDANRQAACARLFALYDKGELVHADPGLALRYADKACSAGEGGSCARLAQAAESGVGAPHDDARALELFRRACTLNDAASCARVRAAESKAAAARAEIERQDRERREKAEREQALRSAEEDRLRAERESAQSRRTAGYVTWGVAALAGLGAGFFAWQGAQQNDKVRGGGFTTAADIQQAIDTGHTYNLAALGCTAGAALAAGLGTLLVFTAHDPPDKPAATKVSLGVAPVGDAPLGLTIAGRFP